MTRKMQYRKKLFSCVSFQFCGVKKTWHLLFLEHFTPEYVLKEQRVAFRGIYWQKWNRIFHFFSFHPVYEVAENVNNKFELSNKGGRQSQCAVSRTEKKTRGKKTLLPS